MLQPNMPWDIEMDNWLQELCGKFGFPFHRVGPNYWQLEITNRQSNYTLTIINQGVWVTYGVVLLDDVVGADEARAFYYGTLLDLSARLNGVHVGMNDNRLVITREEPRADIDINSFYASIALINNAHQIVLSKALQEIKRLGLRLSTQ